MGGCLAVETIVNRGFTSVRQRASWHRTRSVVLRVMGRRRWDGQGTECVLFYFDLDGQQQKAPVVRQTAQGTSRSRGGQLLASQPGVHPGDARFGPPPNSGVDNEARVLRDRSVLLLAIEKSRDRIHQQKQTKTHQRLMCGEITDNSLPTPGRRDRSCDQKWT